MDSDDKGIFPLIFADNFEILEELGQGSFSDVFKVRHKMAGNVYALKRSKEPFSGMADR